MNNALISFLDIILKNEKINDFLLYSFTLLKEHLLNENFDIEYNIADMIQGLSEYKYLKNKSNMKRYYKIHIQPIINKYNYIQFYNIKIY